MPSGHSVGYTLRPFPYRDPIEKHCYGWLITCIPLVNFTHEAKVLFKTLFKHHNRDILKNCVNLHEHAVGSWSYQRMDRWKEDLFYKEQGHIVYVGSQSNWWYLFKKLNVLFIFISDDPVHAAPTTSTRVFYISVGVCCAVIFLVAIILAVLHLHSMKRIELDDRYCIYFLGKEKD